MQFEHASSKIWPGSIRRYVSLSIGAAAAIGLVLWLEGPPITPLLLASLGGSTVFLFGVTSAPAAQPRALFGGHLGCALIGIACYQLFGDGTWVAAMAVVMSLLFMLSTKTVHPPAGANPLIMIYGHAGFSALWQPVGCGVLVLFLVAAIWSRLDRSTVHYPVNWLERLPPPHA
jgi:CBS-domain-containing membrane protein